MNEGSHVRANMQELRLNSSPPPSNEPQDDRLKREFVESQSNDHYKKMLEIRKKLPSYNKAKLICDRIESNQVTVLSGETGCGKSTQVPQYILDDYIMKGMGSQCCIVCTQPRRISTTNLAHRVAEERADRCGGENSSVGYQIRLDENRPRQYGSILYCTTGIVLKNLESDPLLSRVSHLILDEIHERDINSEFLLIIMKEILPHRPNLKLILMSATLNAELFSEYYGRCPILPIPGIIHPVDEYHLEDVVELTRYVPDMTFMGSVKNSPERCDFKLWLRDLDSERYSKSTKEVVDFLSHGSRIDLTLVKELIRHISLKMNDGAILVFLPGWKLITKLQEMMLKEQLFKSDRYRIHIMHSGMMAMEDLQKAFDRPPAGVRKIVLATNVAETSITINDIVYVIDCGLVNLLEYESRTNISALTPVQVSIANSRQRKGRAGRLQPGVCYYMYTSFKHKGDYGLIQDHKPEILRIRLEELCLKIKLLRRGKIVPFLEKAMETPDITTVVKSIDLLVKLNALNADEELTPLGAQLARMPVSPQIGKMILFGALFGCLDPILTAAACLDHKSPCFTPPDEDERSKADQQKQELAQDTHSDHLMFINAYNDWWEAKQAGNSKEFCEEFYLSEYVLKELKLRRNQFAEILCQDGYISQQSPIDPDANINSENEKLLRAILCSGLYPNVGQIKTTRRVQQVGYDQHYYNVEVQGERVGLAKKSVNCDRSIPEPFVVYFEMKRITKKRAPDVLIFDCTGISLNPLIFFGGDLKVNRAISLEKIAKMRVDNWTQFETTEAKAVELKQLRTALWEVLNHKFDKPAPTDWSEEEEEGRVLNKVLRLITEDVPVTIDNQARGS